jgi:hypothetical protein
MQSETKTCQNCKVAFVIEPDDFTFYAKMQVPAPTWCPQCRLQRRMLWHNERYLFRVKSKKSGKEIFSMYPSEAPLTIWDREEWLADGWDQNASGLDYDFSKPFVVQYRELMARAPVPSRGIVALVNSDYSNNATSIKECYLVFGSSFSENCAFMENSVRVKDSQDVSFLTDSELSYECFFNIRCYNALYSSYCEDSHDIVFCRDCVNCSNCFGCADLRGRSYCIWNEPYSKEEYTERVRDLGVQSYAKREALKARVADFWLRYPLRYARSYKNSNCVGEYITNSKNVRYSFQVDGGENIKYSHGLYVRPTRDSYDHYRHGNNSELVYESALAGGDSSRIKFCYHVYTNCSDIEYSWNCNSSSNLFGCVGLNKQQYCILNKRYSEAEYKELLPRIKKHMDEMPYVDKKGREYRYGEFLPGELAPVPYNKTVAMEYFPRTQEDVMGDGYWWGEPERRTYQATFALEKVPDTITEVTDAILSETLGCGHGGTCNHGCTSVFRIVPQELMFYRRLGIPLPRRCPNCRWAERIKQRNPVQLSNRSCQCAGVKSKNGAYQNTAAHTHGNAPCPVEFETSYAPDRPEIIYCEECYQAEVV